MTETERLETCVDCGRRLPREEMFGAAPDFTCPRCADDLRDRLRKTATGRTLGEVISGPAVLTVGTLIVAGLLYVLVHQVYADPRRMVPDWILALFPWSPTGSIGTGDWWRLVTAALLHGGFVHVAFNCYWVWTLGRVVELRWTRAGYLGLFLASAAAGTALEWSFGAGAIGLSGFVYALAGFLWTWRRSDPVAAAVLNPATWRLLIVWYLLCWVIPALNIANWGHTAGLAVGLAAGLGSQQRPRWLWLALLAAAVLALSAWVTTGHRLA